MTDDVNLARPEEDAKSAQPEADAETAQPERDPRTTPFEVDADPPQSEDVPADPGPPAVEAESVPDPAAERDEFRELLLRKQAEFDNYKKRVERDRARANRQAERTLIVALLPLLDDFERALGAPAEGGGAEAYRAGVELIHRQLLEILRKRGVAPIDTAGVRFDPNLHEAVAYQASEGHADGDVIDELRRGYRLDEDLLRAAMVRVAKA
jgi:molecular chaperone GrpE